MVNAPALRIVKKTFNTLSLSGRLHGCGSKGHSETQAGMPLDPSRGNGRETIMRRVLMTALAATTMGFASPALAQSADVNGTTLTSGQSTTIIFGGPAGTTASANLFLTLTGANTANGTFDFSYSFTNNNPSISNLVDFGFTTAQTLVGVAATSGTMGFVLNPNNFPGGFTVNACAFPAGTSCDAANGQADTFAGAFELTFADGTSSISLNNFVDRYASLSQLQGSPSGEGTPVGGVPEPATWAMMLLGFGGIGMAMRRSSRRRNPALAQIA
jgi:hypothetical protein